MQTSAGKFSYNYDVADELTQQNTPTGSISYGYDANGSRILQQAGTARTTYQWDPRNQLSSVTLPTGGRYTQLYRPDDMRLSESGPVGISTMIWSGRGGEGGSGGNGTMDVLGVVATQSGSPMQQVFAHSSGDSASGGAGIGLPLSLSPTPSLVRAMGSHADGAAINRAYHLDNQGGVLALTTATGSIEADYHTDSWGNVISGTAADNPYVYLGGLGYWEDTSLSLNYVRARWQETTTGSWLSVDSVRTEPRYQYAHNSPTRLVDASGRQSAPSGRQWDWTDDLFYGLQQMPGVLLDDVEQGYRRSMPNWHPLRAIKRAAPAAGKFAAAQAQEFLNVLWVLGWSLRVNIKWYNSLRRNLFIM